MGRLVYALIYSGTHTHKHAHAHADGLLQPPSPYIFGSYNQLHEAGDSW